MERVKSLGRYPKGILLLMIVMVLVFAVIYSVTTARVGFAYWNSILVPSQENGNTVYSGEIQGKQASFTVSADNTVVFQHGNKVYGPYTAKEDATAIPADHNKGQQMTGVELCCGEEVIFRGGVYKTLNGWYLFEEDGSTPGGSVHTTSTNGIMVDADGNVIDPMEPSVKTVLSLMAGPEMTHKGQWLMWFGGVFICLIAAVSILFADELFRMNLAFRVRDAEFAEPSDWTISLRYVSWTLQPVIALVLFISGLQ